MIGNISKQKRDDLITKISQVQNFISTASQDENTGSLLIYLSELEKEVKRKKIWTCHCYPSHYYITERLCLDRHASLAMTVECVAR